LSVEQLFHSSPDLRSAVRTLGVLCLAQEAEILRLRVADESWRPLVAHLEAVVEAIPDELWLDVFDGPGRLARIWTAPGVAEAVERLEPRPALAHWGTLRALVRRGLALWFARTTDLIPIRPGDVIPLVERPITTRIEHPTPRMTTAGIGKLLEGLWFRVFDARDGAGVVAELDYSARDLLEPVTWVHDTEDRQGEDDETVMGPPPRLPRVATIHPHSDFFAEFDYDADIDDGWFFSVRPKVFDASWILERLADARERAEIGVLPELCLPEPGALGGALRSDPTRYPPIVVAGSAHVTAQVDGHPVRSNVSVVYLHGVPLLEHKKAHPLVLSIAPGVTLRERLTLEPKVVRCACSDSTRLATVICADLNDQDIPALLEMLGVNLLLVPALTPHEGAFGRTASGLAGMAQGVTVIVNGTPPPSPKDGEPFMVMAGAPDRVPANQVRSFQPPASGRRAHGCLDPNVALSQASIWPDDA
jgi:hypothetical protein